MVKISLTMLKAALAGGMVAIFSATSMAAIATLSEEMAFSSRFCCLAMEDMVVKVKAARDNVGGSRQRESRRFRHERSISKFLDRLGTTAPAKAERADDSEAEILLTVLSPFDSVRGDFFGILE